jgi:hypothetical protein
MAALQGILGQGRISKWLPWTWGAIVLLYLVGYASGTVQASALGSETINLQYVHEFFHHGRHLIFMCH